MLEQTAAFANGLFPFVKYCYKPGQLFNHNSWKPNWCLLLDVESSLPTGRIAKGSLMTF